MNVTTISLPNKRVRSTTFLSNYKSCGDATNKMNRLSLYFYHHVHVIVYRNKGLEEFLGSVFVTHTAEDLTPRSTAIREKFLSCGKNVQ
jgi:hypothetical protein